MKDFRTTLGERQEQKKFTSRPGAIIISYVNYNVGIEEEKKLCMCFIFIISFLLNTCCLQKSSLEFW